MATIVLILVVAAEASPDTELLRGIANAYKANRSAVSAGSIRYKHSRGRADTLAKALSGEWDARRVADCFFAYDENRARHENLYAFEDMLADRKPIGENRWRSTIASSRQLTDGVRTLFDQIGIHPDNTSFMHTAQIFPEAKMFYQNVDPPLRIGVPASNWFQIDKDIERITTDGWKVVAIEEDAQLDDGTSVVRVEFDVKGKQRRIYWLDLEKSANPRRIESISEAPGLTTHIYLNDYRYVSEKLWIPFEQTCWLSDGFAMQSKIVEARFDRRPESSSFELEFPSPVPMIDSATNQRYEPRKVWRLDNLPKPGSKQAKPIFIDQPQPAAPEMPPPLQPRPWWVVPIGIVGILLVGAAGVLYLRRRQGA